MRPIDLTSKESYLAWVQEWKAEYKELSEFIREQKTRKNVHRDRAREMEKSGMKEDAISERLLMDRAWYNRIQSRWKARVMIEARLDGKRKSWEARQAARVQTLAETRVPDVL